LLRPIETGWADRLVLRRQETPLAPEIGGFSIDRMDHQRASADQLRVRHRALKCMLDQISPDPWW